MMDYFTDLLDFDVNEKPFKSALKNASSDVLKEAKDFFLKFPEHNSVALRRVNSEIRKRKQLKIISVRFTTRRSHIKLNKEKFMNKIYLIGNLTRDPELSETSSGTKVCRFSIAVNRDYAGADGERKTDFFNCTAWRGLGETVAMYVKKGQKIAVNGTVQQNQYTDNENVKRTSFEVIAQEVEFLSSNKPEGDLHGEDTSQ